MIWPSQKIKIPPTIICNNNNNNAKKQKIIGIVARLPAYTTLIFLCFPHIHTYTLHTTATYIVHVRIVCTRSSYTYTSWIKCEATTTKSAKKSSFHTTNKPFRMLDEFFRPSKIVSMQTYANRIHTQQTQIHWGQRS